MFGLTSTERDEQVNEAVSFAEGDHAVAPDGREWIVTDGHRKVMGESLTILEAADDRSEKIGITSVEEWKNWEIKRQHVVGWFCAVCEFEGDSKRPPRRCPECDSVCTRKRREFRGGR